MLPDNHDWSRRAAPAQLPELMETSCSRDDLRIALRDLAWVNGMLGGYRPILNWLDSLNLTGRDGAVRILDVGCGYGDTLRRVKHWACENKVPVELTGVDLSADTVAIARDASGSECRIEWVTADVFAYEPQRMPHIVLSSLMTHHLEDQDVMRFLRWMEARAEWGWAVNDLSRHPKPAKLFGWFAKLARLHRFVQHDGPVSFARAFVAEDWRRYCTAAGLNGEVEIRGFTPGRLRVARRKI
jgi:SAM-dependent methyltransferase